MDDELKQSNGSHSGIRIPWKITTKYYVASVDFWLDEMAGDTDLEQVIKGYTDPDNGVGQVVDAFVYVFHKDNVSSKMTHSVYNMGTYTMVARWIVFKV